MFKGAEILGLWKDERPRLDDDTAPRGELCAGGNLEGVCTAE